MKHWVFNQHPLVKWNSFRVNVSIFSPLYIFYPVSWFLHPASMLCPRCPGGLYISLSKIIWLSQYLGWARFCKQWVIGWPDMLPGEMECHGCCIMYALVIKKTYSLHILVNTIWVSCSFIFYNNCCQTPTKSLVKRIVVDFVFTRHNHNNHNLPTQKRQ